jgi:hypothetical protein
MMHSSSALRARQRAPRTTPSHLLTTLVRGLRFLYDADSELMHRPQRT